MPLKVGYKTLLEQARSRIEAIPPTEAQALLEAPDVVFVDIRDVRELERDGMIPGAFHAPRGMLEFWADPESPYHKPVFASGKRLILYCASAWRSALSTDTLQTMGVPRICHLEGGFSAWKAAGLPVVSHEQKP